ncbi:hypothetical protein LTR50_001169 [Elasticomyces elasticus]|nr:hypothetical protein LTR50_001169 [Elasticomyces elasticus]
MALPNIYHHRRVADTASKACMICFKPSTSVLVTPDNRDFFYVCPGHLKDRHFATPVVDEAEAAEKKRKEELEREIEKVKKEYEEKAKRKEERRKEKEKEKTEEKDKKTDKKEKKKQEEEDSKDAKEKEEKIKALSNKDEKGDDGPRIFTLNKYVASA